MPSQNEHWHTLVGLILFILAIFILARLRFST